MIKAFAPVLGKFEGRGMMADGTELTCRFFGEEMLNDLCYGLRLEVISQEHQNHLVNAYVVLSQDTEGKLELQYIDGREHVHSAKWTVAQRAKATGDSRLFSFDGLRPNGSFYRIHFNIVSAEHFRVYMEAANSVQEKPQEIWSLKLEREHSRPYSLRVA